MAAAFCTSPRNLFAQLPEQPLPLERRDHSDQQEPKKQARRAIDVALRQFPDASPEQDDADGREKRKDHACEVTHRGGRGAAHGDK